MFYYIAHDVYVVQFNIYCHVHFLQVSDKQQTETKTVVDRGCEVFKCVCVCVCVCVFVVFFVCKGGWGGGGGGHLDQTSSPQRMQGKVLVVAKVAAKLPEGAKI